MPAATSDPGRRTLPPDRVGARIATATGTSEAPAGASVSSTGTTVSAPAGIIAPVMIRSAVPGPTSSSGARPAGTSPSTRSTTARWTAAPATSAARTAKPSMALFGQGGRVRAERTGSARARPTASARSTLTGDRASMPSSTRRRASSSGIRSGRSGMEALRAAGPGTGRIRPGFSGYAARADGPGNPIERSPTRGRCPSSQRSDRRVAYDSDTLRRRVPANVRHSPSRWPIHAQQHGPYRAPEPEPTLARTAVHHADLVA